MISIRMAEWEHLTAADRPELRTVSFDGAPRARAVARQLARERKLEISEFRTGVEVRSTSFVGRIDVGDLRITVEPKIRRAPLLNLMRYAYGFRPLGLPATSEYASSTTGFLDLLVLQFASEVDELLLRGLARRYRPKREWLASPRGRIAVDAIARRASPGEVALPCRHFPRLADNLPNRVVLGGLHLAARLSSSRPLIRRIRRLAARMETEVASVRIDHADISRVKTQMNRLLRAYEPSITITAMLLESTGVSFDDAADRVHLPAFLFDMNRFFQALLSRFLGEHLTDGQVHDEETLAGMMAYVPGFNPKNRQNPRPRPDFVVTTGNRVRAILDAKYRDLWEHALPREMLYQLMTYALSREDHSTATILYPTTDPTATEQRISIRDPLQAARRAVVVIRPVNLIALEAAVTAGVSQASRTAQAALARHFAFGS